MGAKWVIIREKETASGPFAGVGDECTGDSYVELLLSQFRPHVISGLLRTVLLLIHHHSSNNGHSILVMSTFHHSRICNATRWQRGKGGGHVLLDHLIRAEGVAILPLTEDWVQYW